MKKFAFAPLLLLVILTGLAANSHAQKRPVLNHIALYVTDLAKSSAFYEQLIGLDTIPEPFHDGKHKWFKIGKRSHLHLIEGAKAGTSYDKNTHLCFSIPSIGKFIKLLETKGIEYEDWPGKKHAVTTRIDGVKQIYLQDPDGYWLELNNAKK